MSRYDRTRAEARRQEARRWAIEEDRRQHPDLPFQQAHDLNDTPLLIVARVSTPRQKSDLAGQLATLIECSVRQQASLVGVYSYVGHAANIGHWKKIALRAKQVGAKAILWESTCRAIRHPQWGKDRTLSPMQKQVSLLSKTYHGFDLYTVLDPDEYLRPFRLAGGSPSKDAAAGERREVSISTREGKR